MHYKYVLFVAQVTGLVSRAYTINHYNFIDRLCSKLLPLLLSVTLSVSDKHTSLPRNPYITNIYCFVAQVTGLASRVYTINHYSFIDRLFSKLVPLILSVILTHLDKHTSLTRYPYITTIICCTAQATGLASGACNIKHYTPVTDCVVS
jgi:hypothetical protein